MRRSTLLGLTLSLLFVAGCKVSCTTANISSLTLSKDKEGNVQTKEFTPADTVYARATVSNSGSKVTLKFNLVAEKVEGTPENAPVADADMSIDLESSGSGLYHVRPTNGWPPGRYRIEVAMMYSGEQKDKKSDTFTVTGGGGGAAPTTRPSPPPGPAGGDTPEENANDSEDGSPDSEH
ncbi:MAG TPA: hypothetical protein VGC87_03255 [Pyrinomonadaceae bacterium]